MIVETLGPDRLVPRARAMDHHGQAVLGARAAWQEARDLVRGVVNSAAHREKATQEEIDGVLGLLDLESALQAVSPMDLPFWRSLATLCSPNGPWVVVSHVWMPFSGLTRRSAIRGACLVALSEVLQAHPALNRAYLDGAVWQRHSPEIMLPIRFGPDDLGAVVVDARHETPGSAWVKVRKARTRLLEARKHALHGAFERLLAQWVWAGGFIASPAGALLSDIGGSGIYHSPTPAFVAANGIPISIVVADVDPRNEAGCWVGIGVDHRVFDPAEVGPLHRAFDTRVPELLK